MGGFCQAQLQSSLYRNRKGANAACIGVPVGLVTGYGLTNAILALPRAASILQISPVHLILSWFVGGIVAGALGFFFLAGLVD